MNRKRLSDILRNGERNAIASAWKNTEAAGELTPLPAGTYVARIVSGELATAKSGTPGYKLTFKVLEGEYAGRQFWHDIWLTIVAMPMAKRDLGKLGITSLEQLEQPLPPGIRCVVKLALRRGDDGTEYNRVRSFDVLSIDHPEQDAFAPVDNHPVPDAGDGAIQPEADSTAIQDRAAPELLGDASFAFGANTKGGV